MKAYWQRQPAGEMAEPYGEATSFQALIAGEMRVDDVPLATWADLQELTKGGPVYERWAKVFNLKQMAQTINFLTENNITDYETLVEKTKAATDRYHEMSQQIMEIEKRMAEITELCVWQNKSTANGNIKVQR